MFKVSAHRLLARLVLVWFALFIGIAIASPILNPTETQMVCSSAGGMKMVASGDDVDRVIVDGTTIVEGGRVLTVDMPRAVTRLNDAARAVRERVVL
jgi:hypothetical protein